MAEYEERTEQATPRKRQKAREKGDIARSRELISIAAMGGLILVLYFGGGYVMGNLKILTGSMLGLRYGREPFTVLRAATVDTLLIMLPFLAATFAFSLAAGVAQGGVVLRPLQFKTEALNPLNGLKRIFSLRGLMEFFKSLLKFIVGGYIFYLVIKKDLPLLPGLSAMGLTTLARVASVMLMKAVLYGFACYFILGILDFLLQRWQFERSLRMSREEMKEEHKESEGDPKVKARMKGLHMQMARRRMMEEVPKATVVITNPTHLAVALRYEDGKMAAPRVVAKGAGFLAEKIREVAGKHRVPIVEDKPLARVLFTLEIEEVIPHELYRAVAGILAHIFRMRGKR